MVQYAGTPAHRKLSIAQVDRNSKPMKNENLYLSQSLFKASLKALMASQNSNARFAPRGTGKELDTYSFQKCHYTSFLL